MCHHYTGHAGKGKGTNKSVTGNSCQLTQYACSLL